MPTLHGTPYSASDDGSVTADGTSCRRRTLFKGAVLAATGLGFGLGPAWQTAFAAPGATWDPNAGWSVIPALGDDFSNPARSNSIWHRGLWYPVSGEGTFSDKNVAVTDGQLRLAAAKGHLDGSAGGPAYTFGAVESTLDVPGVCTYIEVKAKVLPSAANVLSAVWLQSSNLNGGPELLNGADPHPEIDIEETFHFTSMDMATHTWGDKHMAFGGHNYQTGLADISTDYHLFGVERRDDHLRFYFDRHLAWDLKAPHASLARMSRHIVLSLEGHLGKPVDQHLPAHYAIDDVRAYYYTAGRRAQPGTYRIVHAATGKALTRREGASALTVQDVGGQGQLWSVTQAEDFTYSITDDSRTVMLGLDGGKGQVGVPVVTVPNAETTYDSAGTRRRWHLLAGGGEAFSIRSAFSGLAMAPSGDHLDQQEPAGHAHEWTLQSAS
ncbi:RICIN domain-containing protein [Devriesea agamarum]|uniref:RICIN domain-containing protein n=1 Tax=Devriesea agamarum TaxID=472569 RepID=UPI00071D464E|nr:RICIN domain-containing protein [Devriesea agamarum]